MSHRVHVPTLYVVRHAEPELTGRLLGRSDPPLSAHGREQMARVQLPVERIYTSRLARAQESAVILAGAREVIVMPDLDEMTLGDWDGKSWAEIENEYPEIAARKLQDWAGVTPPGGEQWSRFTTRVDRALDSIRTGPLPAAVVAHLTVNSWIAHRLTGADPLSFRQDYAQALCYDIGNSRT